MTKSSSHTEVVCKYHRLYTWISGLLPSGMPKSFYRVSSSELYVRLWVADFLLGSTSLSLDEKTILLSTSPQSAGKQLAWFWRSKTRTKCPKPVRNECWIFANNTRCKKMYYSKSCRALAACNCKRASAIDSRCSILKTAVSRIMLSTNQRAIRTRASFSRW